jgi:hypothetical protein
MYTINYVLLRQEKDDSVDKNHSPKLSSICFVFYFMKKSKQGSLFHAIFVFDEIVVALQPIPIQQLCTSEYLFLILHGAL